MKEAEALKRRTKQFGLRVIRPWRTLLRTEEARVIGKQLLRSATAVAANYRATCRARSKAEVIAKIGVVVEEIDESVLWLEYLADAEIMKPAELASLQKEANELLAIFTASQLTAKSVNSTMIQSDNPSI